MKHVPAILEVPELATAPLDPTRYLAGKKILICGGTGSIGRELAVQLMKYGPDVVRILSRDDHKQFQLRSGPLKEYDNIRYLLGDIRDKDRLRLALKDVEVVFHAAAIKRVEVAEYDPFEAVETNVRGAENLIRVALESPSIERVVNISTDKAINPTSVMGASKLLAERLFTRANFFSSEDEPIFCSARFGNVLNSRGSIMEIVRDCVRAGRPVPLTNPNMTRFILTIPQAVDLMLASLAYSLGGEVFILKMKVARVDDLVEVTREYYLEKTGRSPRACPIIPVGERLGEKLHEGLINVDEEGRCLELPNFFVIQPPSDRALFGGARPVENYPDAVPLRRCRYDSSDGPILDRDALKRMIREADESRFTAFDF